MKKFVLLLAAAAMSFNATAQCNNLFISEYVEGSDNNKAVEIYNASPAAINLGNFGIGRFDNGANTLTAATFVRLAPRNLQPYSTYVVCLNKGGSNPTDTAGVSTEKPLYNGYQVMKPYARVGANPCNPCLGAQGDTIYTAKYNGLAATQRMEWEQTYKNRWDLRSRCDTFVAPVYANNKTLYHNGDDAIALINGTTATSPVLDAVGIIGDCTPVKSTSCRCGTCTGPGSWEDFTAPTTSYLRFLTQDRTLVRKPTFLKARPLADDLGNTPFNIEDFTIYTSDNFTKLGKHDCNCKVVATDNRIAKETFGVFPNPAQKGTITLNGTQNIRTAMITNPIGQIVQQVKFAGNNSEQMNIETVQSGIYFITVEFVNGQRASQKLIVE